MQVKYIKDHWSDWDRNPVDPPEFNVKAYQSRLDEIAGKSRDKSILKLEWGGNSYSSRYESWGELGMPGQEIQVPRFALTRVNRILGVTEYIPIRRWIITQRAEPEVYGFGTEDGNTFQNEFGVVCKVAEKPKELYTPYIYIGDHSSCPVDCCKTRICLGDYKLPGYEELDLVLEHTYKLLIDRQVNPYSSKISEANYQAILSEQEDRSNKLEQELDNILLDQTTDFLNAHSHRLSDIVSTEKYFDLGRKKNV